MARSLAKTEPTEETDSEIEKMNDGKKEDEDPAEWEKEKKDNSHNGSDNVGKTSTDKRKGKQKSKQPAGKSQYEKDKECNVGELKEILTNLKAQYPMPAEFSGEASLKKEVKKKQEKREPVVRRKSQRTKDKIRWVV